MLRKAPHTALSMTWVCQCKNGALGLAGEAGRGVQRLGRSVELSSFIDLQRCSILSLFKEAYEAVLKIGMSAAYIGSGASFYPSFPFLMLRPRVRLEE